MNSTPPPSKAKRAVIFDVDGTLTSFNLDCRTVRAEVRSYLITKDLPPAILSVNESIFKMRNRVEFFLENRGKPGRVAREIRSEALEIAEKYEWEAAKNTRLLPGVKETLKELKEEGVKMGVFTINSEKSTVHILEKFGLKGFFQVVISRNSVRHVKPHIQHLEAALKGLRVNPEEAIVVGDGRSDMKCAEKVGATVIGVITGVSSADRLINWGAQYVITSIRDLPVLIREIVKTEDSKTNPVIDPGGG